MRRVHPLCVVGIALALVTSCTQPEGNRSAAPSGSEPSSAAGTTRATGTSTAADGAKGLPRPDHVMVAVFENEDASAIVGRRRGAVPDLAGRAGRELHRRPRRDPSQPAELPGAVLRLDAGRRRTTRCPLTFTGANLAAPAAGAGPPSPATPRACPRPGYTGLREPATTRASTTRGSTSPTCRPRSTSRSARFPTDYADLPTVSFVVPDLCNDMHDCDVADRRRLGRRRTSRPTSSWAQDAQQPADRHLRRGQRHGATTSPRSRRARGRRGRPATSGSTTTTCCAPSRTCTACRRSARRPAHGRSPGSGRRPDLPGP